MNVNIRRAVVLGSGVMGAQIAALLATAGVRVHLLDLCDQEAPKNPEHAKKVGKNFRSARAILAVENLKTLKPSPLASSSVLSNLIPGNFDDDMAVVADADWIIEAVVERLDIKQSLFKKVLEVARAGTPITTNTSGIALHKICADFPEHFKSSFFGTHFFNPPRYMHLVEIIPHAETDKALMGRLSDWIASRLGKGVVLANDTINFIANRIGVFNMQSTMRHMAELNLNIETIDALTGKLMGRPSSATYRTMDVVGLDTMAHVARNVIDLVKDDPYYDWFTPPAWLAKLIEKGALGQKTNNVGCYKKTKNAAGKTEILAYRPTTETYEPQQPQEFAWMPAAAKQADTLKRLQDIIKENDAGAQLIWRTLRDTLSYSALLLDDIANGSPKALDDAIRWGFNWEWGPFAIWQALGYDTLLQRMQKEDVKLPAWAKPGVKFYDHTPGSEAWALHGPTQQYITSKDSMTAIKSEPQQLHLPNAQNAADKRVVFSNRSASLVDIQDGVACLVFHSKMNTINDEIIDALQKTAALVQKDFGALVIGNDADNFSAGANLKAVLDLIHKKDWAGIETMLRHFQGALQMIKYAPFPSVACPTGLVLGGGCEVALHTTAQLLALETYSGLVEMGVGLIPAGGGTKELALRAYAQTAGIDRADPMPYLQRAFMLIGTARTSTSGSEAIDMGLYGHNAAMTISRPHQVARGKSFALEMLRQGYVPQTPRTAVQVVGDPGIQTIRMALYNMVEGRMISAYDAFIGERVATVLCGGAIDPGLSVSEDYLLALERAAFVELCQQPKTVERIEGMLKTGKPVRN